MTIFSYPFGDDFFRGFKPHQNDLTMKIREGNQRQGFAVFITFHHCFIELVEGNVHSMTTGDFHRFPPFQRVYCANILFSQRSNISDWWFGTFLIFSIYWQQQSQLTHWYFSEGWPNHQPDMVRYWGENPVQWAAGHQIFRSLEETMGYAETLGLGSSHFGNPIDLQSFFFPRNLRISGDFSHFQDHKSRNMAFFLGTYMYIYIYTYYIYIYIYTYWVSENAVAHGACRKLA